MHVRMCDLCHRVEITGYGPAVCVACLEVEIYHATHCGCVLTYDDEGLREAAGEPKTSRARTISADIAAGITAYPPPTTCGGCGLHANYDALLCDNCVRLEAESIPAVYAPRVMNEPTEDEK